MLTRSCRNRLGPLRQPELDERAESIGHAPMLVDALAARLVPAAGEDAAERLAAAMDGAR